MICEKHYNQIVATNKLYKTLLNLNTDRDSDIHVIQRKRSQEVNIFESHTSTIDTVADRSYIGESDISEELQRTKDMLEISKSECQQQSITIMDLNNKITQLQQQLEKYECKISELEKKLEDSYDHIDEIENHKISELKKKLGTSYDHIDEIQNLY